jgi:hypothetical protein
LRITPGDLWIGEGLRRRQSTRIDSRFDGIRGELTAHPGAKTDGVLREDVGRMEKRGAATASGERQGKEW